MGSDRPPRGRALLLRLALRRCGCRFPGAELRGYRRDFPSGLRTPHLVATHVAFHSDPSRYRPIVVVGLALTPLLSPYRLAANSQYHVILDGRYVALMQRRSPYWPHVSPFDSLARFTDYRFTPPDARSIPISREYSLISRGMAPMSSFCCPFTAVPSIRTVQDIGNTSGCSTPKE